MSGAFLVFGFWLENFLVAQAFLPVRNRLESLFHLWLIM